jgi:hypothetical protein
MMLDDRGVGVGESDGCLSNVNSHNGAADEGLLERFAVAFAAAIG